MALITAELATAIPEDGGIAVWVKMACGERLGAHNAYWMWVSWMFDAAIYPVLCGGYIGNAVRGSTGGGSEVDGLIAFGVVVLTTMVKLAGSTFMVRFSTVLAIISLVPAVLFIAVGAADGLTAAAWFVTVDDCDTNIPALVAFMIWLNSGFLSLGALAGDVVNPRRTFTLTVAVLIPFVVLINSAPLMVGLSIDSTRCLELRPNQTQPVIYGGLPDASSTAIPSGPGGAANTCDGDIVSDDGIDADTPWREGYFSTLAARPSGGGAWLVALLTIGAAVCLIGLYNSDIITCETALLFAFEHYLPNFVSETALAEAGPIRRWCFQRSERGYGRFYVVFNGTCAGLLCWAPYNLLVQFSVLMMSM